VRQEVRTGQALRKELLARRTTRSTPCLHKPGRKPKARLTRPARVPVYGAGDMTPADDFFRNVHHKPRMSEDQIARQEAQIAMLQKACK